MTTVCPSGPLEPLVMCRVPRRPILRWHGGKWKQARWIVQHLPPHRVYVEPFGGAASVLLWKSRSYAEVYNDMDGEIVNLFRVVRDRGDELRRALELTPFARDEFDLSYSPADCALEQARRTVLRSFAGFGSNMSKTTSTGSIERTGFRANSNRSGTTPAHDWRNYPSHLPDIVDRLRGVVIENRDANQVMRAHDGEQTVHYVDPPYVPGTRDAGSDYRHELTEADHVTLAETLRSLRGVVVLSGYDSDLYRDLFGDWRRIERAAHADGARPRTECLWLSPRCPAAGLFEAPNAEFSGLGPTE